MNELKDLELLDSADARKAMERLDQLVKDLRWSYLSDPHNTVSFDKVADAYLAIIVKQQQLIKWLWTSKVDKP